MPAITGGPRRRRGSSHAGPRQCATQGLHESRKFPPKRHDSAAPSRMFACPSASWISARRRAVLPETGRENVTQDVGRDRAAHDGADLVLRDGKMVRARDRAPPQRQAMAVSATDQPVAPQPLSPHRHHSLGLVPPAHPAPLTERPARRRGVMASPDPLRQRTDLRSAKLRPPTKGQLAEPQVVAAVGLHAPFQDSSPAHRIRRSGRSSRSDAIAKAGRSQRGASRSVVAAIGGGRFWLVWHPRMVAERLRSGPVTAFSRPGHY
jgi:hypothetical protein